MTSIIRPPHVLIDSGHLVNMTRIIHGQAARTPRDWTAAYEEILKQMRAGFVMLLFFEPLSYEWIQGTTDGRLEEIARVLDAARIRKTVATDHSLFRIEATREATRVAPELSFPAIDPIRPFGPDHELSDWTRAIYPDDAARLVSVPVVQRSRGLPTTLEVVRAIAPVVRRGGDEWREAWDGHLEAVRTTREAQRRYGQPGLPPTHWKNHWLKTALGLHETIRFHHPGADAERIIARMDVSRCPAVSLKCDVMWQYARRANNPEENDLLDLTLVAPLAYADLTLTEKRLADLVRQSSHSAIAERVHRSPGTFLAALTDGLFPA